MESSQRRDSATEASRRWRSSNPSRRDAYVYETALHSAGEVERVRKVLDDAYRRHPGGRSLRAGPVTLSRDVGGLQIALAYVVDLVELIPEDPGAQQLLAEIRSRLSGEQ